MRRVLVGAILSSVVFAGPKIEIKDAWVREVPPTSKMSAAYMLIENKGDEGDRLVGASSDVSKITELHETIEGKMRKVKVIEVPAGKSVELKPGGYHIMLINLEKPLKEGDKVSITLKFEKSGKVEVSAPVKKGAGTMKHPHH